MRPAGPLRRARVITALHLQNLGCKESMLEPCLNFRREIINLHS